MDSRKDSFIKRLIPARGYQFREGKEVLKTRKSNIYLLLNTNGTRRGLRDNQGKRHGDSYAHITYTVVKLWRNAVMRAYRSSRVSPTNSGSSLTSILYRDTSVVMMAMPSVSKNLEKYEDLTFRT